MRCSHHRFTTHWTIFLALRKLQLGEFTTSNFAYFKRTPPFFGQNTGAMFFKSSLKASSPEFKRRKIAVSCLSTLKFALDAISNNKNARKYDLWFSELCPNFRLASLIPCSACWYTIAQRNQAHRIRVYPRSPFDWLDTLQCIQKCPYLEIRTADRINWLTAILYEDFPKILPIFGKFSVGCLSVKWSFDIKAGFSLGLSLHIMAYF